ncbi:zeta toxin family protein [Planosporangium sp. 12N6]|uniref:zeta toxin family protein n=1 Tax=Planosporangium spinosum TaxID=3402278 RepID=UPI003CE8C4D0
MSQLDPQEPRLTEAEAARIFVQDIVPDLLAGGQPSEQPIVVIVAGQPGAGKSRAQAALLAALGREDTVSIDADDLRPYHPRYDELARADDLTASARAHPEAARWVSMAIDYVITRHVDVVVSATLGSPDTAATMIDRFRQADYRVEVAVVAVDDVRSRLGVLSRYQSQRDQLGIGRYVPPDAQRRAYTGLLDTVDRIDREHLVDAVHVYNRNGQQLYTNQRAATGWDQTAGTRAAIEIERARGWTPDEATQVVTTANELARYLRVELRGELAAVVRDARDRVHAVRADSPESAAPTTSVDPAHRAAQAWSTPTQQALRRASPPLTPPPTRFTRQDERDDRGPAR